MRYIETGYSLQIVNLWSRETEFKMARVCQTEGITGIKWRQYTN